MQNPFGFWTLILAFLCILPTQQRETIVDLTPSQLIARFPELKKLDFAQTQEEFPRLLERVGDRVQEYFRDFPNTSSLERVRLEVLDYQGDVIRSVNRKFQYLLITHAVRVESKTTPSGGETMVTPEEGQMKLQEYRTDDKGAEVDIEKLKGFFMLTKGYASIPLYFHPFYRSEAVFRCLGRESAGSKNWLIAFTQRPDVARLAGRFHSSLGPLPMWVQGIAWIDPTNYQVVRMRTDLLRILPEIGLQQNTTEIELEETRFSQTSHTLWLPREVVVTTRWMGRLYRNRHRYSNYELFSVDAKDDQKHRIVARP